MRYIEEKRKLENSTGYIRRIETGECYKASYIILGKYDNKDNYEEISEEDYNAWLEEEEEKRLKEQFEFFNENK